ncbi:glycogenin-1-like isoform X2 [Babylonia areolata]|uniref:glycogenin-1-like isoform X2 n=1 Tax=Babylonia areolata TaxID=304850 RepID=UPI003FD1CB13
MWCHVVSCGKMCFQHRGLSHTGHHRCHVVSCGVVSCRVMSCHVVWCVSSAQKEAWVTLATTDANAVGCMVLGNSLKRAGTTRQLVVMVTEGVSQGLRSQLMKVFDKLEDVNKGDIQGAGNLPVQSRPDLIGMFNKIHCWMLTQYNKCVFVDADTLVVEKCDELFDKEELSAAPDPDSPKRFDSGVFVFRPSSETYQVILALALSKESVEGGDQGLLNTYFLSRATSCLWPLFASLHRLYVEKGQGQGSFKCRHCHAASTCGRCRFWFPPLLFILGRFFTAMWRR